VAATAVLLFGPVGCSGGGSDPVTVPAPRLTGESARQCSDLGRELPSQVADLWSRDVTTDGVAAAWGAPPIVLRCGVSDAIGLGPASRCDMLDGVGWYSERLDDGYRFTTIGRAVPIELTVPGEYEPESDALVDLADAIKRAIPITKPCV
jgi:hypothetical protein